MDLEHALRIFKLYCYIYRRSAAEAESILWSEREREAIRQLKRLVRESADLFREEDSALTAKAA
ncbi:MAG: hypothetical protein GX443_09105 [Deltaproteobacteria bacterium]|nr:hypothetical protein [Deltaproteobacteria bacterium]